MELHNSDYSYKQQEASPIGHLEHSEVKAEEKQNAEVAHTPKNTLEVSHDVSKVSHPVLSQSSSSHESIDSHQIHVGSNEQGKHCEEKMGNIAEKNGKLMLANIQRSAVLSGTKDLKSLIPAKDISNHGSNINLEKNLNNSHAQQLQSKLNSAVFSSKLPSAKLGVELVSSASTGGGHAAKLEVANQKLANVEKTASDGMEYLLGPLPEGDNKENLKTKVEPMVKEIAVTIQSKKDAAQAENVQLQSIHDSIDPKSNAPLSKHEKALLESPDAKAFINSGGFQKSWGRSHFLPINGELSNANQRELLSQYTRSQLANKPPDERRRLEALDASINKKPNAPLSESEKALLGSEECQKFIKNPDTREAWEAAHPLPIDANNNSEQREVLKAVVQNKINRNNDFIDVDPKMMLPAEIMGLDFKEILNGKPPAFKKDFKHKSVATELTNAYVGTVDTLFSQTNETLKKLNKDDGGDKHELRRELNNNFDSMTATNKLLFDPAVKEQYNSKIKKLEPAVNKERTEFEQEQRVRDLATNLEKLSTQTKESIQRLQNAPDADKHAIRQELLSSFDGMEQSNKKVADPVLKAKYAAEMKELRPIVNKEQAEYNRVNHDNMTIPRVEKLLSDTNELMEQLKTAPDGDKKELEKKILSDFKELDTSNKSLSDSEIKEKNTAEIKELKSLIDLNINIPKG